MEGGILGGLLALLVCCWGDCYCYSRVWVGLGEHVLVCVSQWIKICTFYRQDQGNQCRNSLGRANMTGRDTLVGQGRLVTHMGFIRDDLSMLLTSGVWWKGGSSGAFCWCVAGETATVIIVGSGLFWGITC